MTKCNRQFAERALVFDLLDGEEKARFESHLVECGDCAGKIGRIQRSEKELRTLRGGLHGLHPAPEQLYDFAAGPGALPSGEASRALVNLHLKRCDACASDVERIRRIDPKSVPVRQILEGALPPADGSADGAATVSELMRRVDARLAARPTRSGEAGESTEDRPAPIRRFRYAVPAAAAAAGLFVALLLLFRSPTDATPRWIVATPDSGARRLTPDGPVPLRAGETLFSDADVENAGSDDLVLFDVPAPGREPRVSVLRPGGRLRGGAGLEGAPAENVGVLVGTLVDPGLPTLRALPQRSGLIAPRLTIRERRPEFAFGAAEAGERFRVVVSRKNLETGETATLFTTPESPGPLLAFPEDAPSLAYDADFAFEWQLERLTDVGTETVGPIDFYLDPDPDASGRAADAILRSVPNSPSTGHFLAAQHFLRSDLYLDAIRELLASDPDLSDAGVRSLFEKIARNLEIDPGLARILLAPAPR